MRKQILEDKVVKVLTHVEQCGTSNGDRNGCPDEDERVIDPESGTNGSEGLDNGADAPWRQFTVERHRQEDTAAIHLLQYRVTIVSTTSVSTINVTDVDTDGDGYRMRTPPL